MPLDSPHRTPRQDQMRYAYHDLHPDQFEALAVEICHELLGPGVQEFATGPDGGRDAKFVGTAQAFPSAAAPLVGKVIVQAKHTSNPIGKFSDSDFSGDAASSTLEEEYPRIRALVNGAHLDHYLLFSNRRLGAQANEDVCEQIRTRTGASSVHLIGVEAMDRYLKRMPHAAGLLEGFEYDLPLRASPDDLAEVIVAIAKDTGNVDWTLARSPTVEERLRFKEKNTLNGLSDEYAEVISRRYMRDFEVVRHFLEDPANYQVNAYYREAADEFAARMAAHRGSFAVYDRLLQHLLDGLIERDGDLKAHKRITRTVYYFMYWACDIGTPVGDEADATA